MILGVNPPAALGVALFAVCTNSASLRDCSFGVSVQSVFLDQIHRMITFLQIPPRLRALSWFLCFHATLPAVEDLASQISSPLVGDGTSGSSAVWRTQNGEEIAAC